MNGILIPIIGKARQDDAILRHSLDEFVWPGTDRVGRERAVAGGFRRHHHAGAVAERREQRRKGTRQDELDGMIINDLDGLHGADLGLAVRAGKVQMTLDVEFDRGGVELLAVLERDAPAQLHDQGFVAVSPGPLRRELRDDGQIPVDVDELVT